MQTLIKSTKTAKPMSQTIGKVYTREEIGKAQIRLALKEVRKGEFNF